MSTSHQTEMIMAYEEELLPKDKHQKKIDIQRMHYNKAVEYLDELKQAYRLQYPRRPFLTSKIR